MPTRRPKKTCPRTHGYRIRLDDEEYEKLQYLMKHAKIKPSDIFRNTLNNAYDEVYIPEPTELEIRMAENLGPALLQLTKYLKGD